MKSAILSIIAAVMISTVCFSQSGDTVTVQTFTFGSPQDAWFEFPPDTVRFEKIIMKYTLKCNPAQNPACGEWDYQTSTTLYDYTGLQDSSVINQPVFRVNGNAPDTLYASYSQTFSTTGNFQYFNVYDDTLTLSTYPLGAGSTTSPHPFAAEMPVSRAFFLWRASELTTAGMSAGNITGLRFNVQSGSVTLKNMKIRLKQTSDNTIDSEDIDFQGFDLVYSMNTSIAPGWNDFAFLQAFAWNGTDNIIIEISFENNTSAVSPLVFSENTGFDCGAVRADNDRCVKFQGNNYISVAVTDTLNTLDTAVTVSFWHYGNPQFQPQDGTCFEGIRANGNRVLNAHIPWSNSRIYWDAGVNAAGNYDRIDKAANPDEFMGKWNQWTMTKNVTQETMKVYLNGILWHSGTNKSHEFDVITNFMIGRGNWSGSTSFSGRMDEFAIFRTEMSANEILDNYKTPITPTHPHYDDLIMYFRFNEGNGIFVTDSAKANTVPSYMFGASNPLKSPEDYVNNFTSTQIRPDIIFEQGTFNQHIDSLFVTDSIANNPLMVVFYSDSINNPGVPTDTLVVWPSNYYMYVYDSQGIITDSTFVVTDSMFVNSSYNYFHYFPQIIRYEMGRYITPYGNGLSLGDGWTWTFDVSDYRTLLADSVRLTAGNWQELLDLKFLMIKGTPPRDIISIESLWYGQYNYGDPSVPFDDLVLPKKIKVPENTVNARWKSRITGHGMDSPQNCAEFCSKWHYFDVNGVQQFTKLVWRNNCGVNPLFPQGGTWVYNRANWCPGAEVETYNFELTPFITPGDSIELRHRAQPYVKTSGWSFYEVVDQVVFYGAPNFTLDAAIENVLVPTTDDMWRRKNPACTDPIVIIKNTGTTPLTSLEIDFGVVGGQSSTYQWTGNLQFLETAEVNLGNFHWTQSASKFQISIKNPNGGTDQYPHNNEWISDFVYPLLMPETFFIEFKTNNRPQENQYTLTDDQGNIILSKSGLTANTVYRDTLTLLQGCYIFKLTDTGNDGLTWWANSAQGSGYIRFRSATTPQVLKNFNSDFGAEVYIQFTVGLTNSTEEELVAKSSVAEMFIIPNPAEDYVDVSFNLKQPEAGQIDIIDVLGKTVYSTSFEKCIAGNKTIDVSGLNAGIYIVNVRTENNRMTARMVVR